MSIFDIFTGSVFTTSNKSAKTAKDRLRIIVEASGRSNGNPEVEKLKALILDLIAQHTKVEKNDVVINIGEQNGKSVLELSVNLPADS
ncbi:MAG: cell division topological specificity factor MinE [Pseudomonadota bacterium]|nr:cell division topological specificity factor MinE [Pseudomonadota bacterium]